jgi:hypothetical protein
MDATNPVSPTPEEIVATGSKDGDGAGDRDEPYRFGRKPNAQAPYPFNERQYARLLILRSRLDGSPSDDDRRSTPSAA